VAGLLIRRDGANEVELSANRHWRRPLSNALAFPAELLGFGCRRAMAALESGSVDFRTVSSCRFGGVELSLMRYRFAHLGVIAPAVEGGQTFDYLSLR
jgi:hypothetical protein